jgi:hypothetical protein
MITEHLMRPGSGTIRFRRTLPRSISKQITDMIEGAGCHLVITPVRLNEADLLDSVLLSAAMYTGVVLARPSRTELAVTGLGWWLDSVNETNITRVSGTPTQWLGDLLINGLTTGTVSGGSNVTRQFIAHAQTRREALDTVATLGSWEYDIQPDFTVDAGTPSAIFQSPPSVVITNRAEGVDGPFRGLSAGLLSQSVDASQTATKAVVLGQGQGTAVVLGSATQSVPLKTYSGGTPTIVKAIDAPTEAQAQLAASASATLAASKVVTSVRVATPAMGPGSTGAQIRAAQTPTVARRTTGGMFSTGPGSGATVTANPVRLTPPSATLDPAIAERDSLLAQAGSALASARTLAGNSARGFLGLRRTSGGRSTGTDSDLTRRLLRPGDEVYLFDLESGLYDTANEIVYRGETISPALVRVLSMTWPVSARYGVYIRSNASTPTIIDISSYVEAETGGAFIDVGSRPAGSYVTSSRSNPQLEARLGDSAPLGRVAHEFGGASDITGLTAVDVLNESFTAYTDRWYKTTVSINAQKTGTADALTISLHSTTGGGGGLTSKSYTMAVNELGNLELTWIETGLSGTVTRVARVGATSGTWTYVGSFARQAVMVIEDIGRA